MKKHFTLVLLLAALTAVSCEKKEAENTKPKTQGTPILNSIEFAASATDCVCKMDWDKNGQAIIKWGATIATTEAGLNDPDAISVIGNTVLFCDLKPSTKYYVRGYASNSKGNTDSEIKSFTTKATESNKAVDMGVSVKWASINLGGSSPEDVGYYYFWADTQGRNGYAIDGFSFLYDNYKYFSDTPCETYKFTIRKYCNLPECGYQGYTDALTAIEAGDDAATAALGGKWRMPTDAEWTELREKCSWTMTAHDGMKGYEVKATNGNKIFLPLSGYRSDIRLITCGSFGNYWSSSLCVELCTDAWTVALAPTGVTRITDRRDRGFTIRAVSD